MKFDIISKRLALMKLIYPNYYKNRIKLN